MKRILLAIALLSLATPAFAETKISPKQISNGGTSNTTDFLRRDGTWAAPASGSLTDGDKGDITVSGTGATWTVDNDVVTYGKMQNVSAASKLLGRGDSGSGDPQEITLGSGLTMTGTTLSASGGGSSSWTQIGSTQTPTGASVTFSSIPSTYSDLMVELDGISHTSGSNQSIRIEYSNDNSSFSTAILISAVNAAASNVYGSVFIHAYQHSVGSTTGVTGVVAADPGAFNQTASIANSWRVAGGITAIRLSPGSGNFDAGTIKLYGK